jgi:CRP-like cAMP-binding protein
VPKRLTFRRRGGAIGACSGRHDGELEITNGAHGTAGRGDFFGEIALIRDVPRTATVQAMTPSRLYALEREDFLAAVTGHSAVRSAGEAVVSERLPAETVPAASESP